MEQGIPPGGRRGGPPQGVSSFAFLCQHTLHTSLAAGGGGGAGRGRRAGHFDSGWKGGGRRAGRLEISGQAGILTRHVSLLLALHSTSLTCPYLGIWKRQEGGAHDHTVVVTVVVVGSGQATGRTSPATLLGRAEAFPSLLPDRAEKGSGAGLGGQGQA